MREKKGNCPRCNQYRSNLRSINYLDDRIHGMTISKDGKRIGYLCYECRHEIDKGLKNGSKLVNLLGNGFTILGYGLPKYMERIQKELKMSKQIIKKSLDFINNVYGKWIEIQSEDIIKYYFASLIMILKKENKQKNLEDFINKNYTNISIDEIYEKLNEISLWCKSKGDYEPF